MTRRARSLVIALGVALIAAAGVGAWYITQRATQDRPIVVSRIGDVALVYAPAYARFAGGRVGGRIEALDIAATFPDFRPAGDATTPLSDVDGRGKSALVFLTLGPADRKIDPPDLVATLYARFLEPEVVETEEGLLKRRFQDGSPYAGEDLYFAPPEGRTFAARCTRATTPSDGLPETCLTVFRERDLDVSLRFARPLLGQWDKLAAGARALTQTMLAR